jgi:carboxypeptidase Q
MKTFILGLLICIPLEQLMAQHDEPDLNMIKKIRQEGFNHSQVMDLAFFLTEASGPRLNNSPGFRRAAGFTKNKLNEWGLTNARLEPFGEWGKGWELKRCYVAMSAPYYKPIIAFPKSWTAGTNGLQTADVVLLSVGDAGDLETYKGKLNGKVILLRRIDSLEPAYVADATRYSEEELKEMADWKKVETGQNKTANAGLPGKGYTSAHSHEKPAIKRPGALSYTQLKQFARDEGAIAILSTNPRGRDGTLFVQGGGPWGGSAAENFPDMMLAYEDYMMLQFHTDDLQGYNVIAEIKGADPKLKHELVMIGAHLDSWHASVGATDNAAGCAVMLEVMRILKTLNVQPRRTIRIALWGGEEQGLIGSKNYVRQHFTDTATQRFNTAGDKVSVYFNLDNGTGKIRGIYLQENTAVQPIFTKWLQPFKDLGASTITLQRTGGTDHLSFDAIGLPGFQFIQDDIEYDSRTHHSNMDSYDHLQPADLKQAAVIIASFVYHAAMRNEKIPRK